MRVCSAERREGTAGSGLKARRRPWRVQQTPLLPEPMPDGTKLLLDTQSRHAVWCGRVTMQQEHGAVACAQSVEEVLLPFLVRGNCCRLDQPGAIGDVFTYTGPVVASTMMAPAQGRVLTYDHGDVGRQGLACAAAAGGGWHYLRVSSGVGA